MENSCPPVELMTGHDSVSLEVNDSNALILPTKRSKKRKVKNQGLERVKEKQIPKLSKSQIRKLKKLEEEKEKTLLLSKSIETLEKYKIPEDAYSLLQSSKTIGWAETMREKRRRAIQFSKAGLEVPHSDKFSNGREGDNLCSSSEPELELEEIKSCKDISKNHIGQPMMIEREVASHACDTLASSQELVSGKDLGLSCSPVHTLPTMEVTLKDNGAPLEEGIKTCIPKLSVNDGRKSSMVMGHVSVPTVVHVSRPVEIENKRKDLPIVMMEQEIMEAINENSTVIICGETGCGKTTQVPQFLYEAGFGSNRSTLRSGVIGVTQPRRVAVLATAKRVAFELGLNLGKEVGFQVRHDKKIGDRCSIKFMTDGILLREVQNDVLLKHYSVIILDEAHERSLNTDILIGMLSRVIQLRQDLYEKQQQMVLSGQSIGPENMILPLTLVLMSATLRVEDFISGRRLFLVPPPVIEVPTRQYPVTIHFSKRTELVDYIGQAFKKVMSINKRLPQGGILVFVTGQREVEYLCRRLRKASGKVTASISNRDKSTVATASSQINSVEDIDMKDVSEAFEINGDSTHQQTDRFSSYDEDKNDYDEDDSDASYDSETESELETFAEDGNKLDQKSMENGDNLVDVLGGDGSLASLKAAFEALAGKSRLDSNPEGQEAVPINPESSLEQPSAPIEKISEGNRSLNAGPLRVLPLYAMLPAAAQLRVFEEVNDGERLVVVATNVAETSLTIPGIKYVVDTGREKVKNYNPTNGMESYEIQWISKASAAQRAGRAGRTGPGHCYRLYSPAVFNNILPDFSCTEISKIPVDGIVLLMKSMGIDKVANLKGLVVDESMSNLTSTSGEVSASGTRFETGTLYPRQSLAPTSQAPPPKRKRSLPGNPDPDAEVIALSPKTLLATNRFICEICNKGFQRDQNLQLHRRGHNLPWKLKQRTNKEVIRKKVYVCPETTCVHHDPSRALGDLTGVKKHFSRKHGEKKWKCEKCSKRYAVQSDRKAHSKICGTREYRCDCGTLFSRRDSFLTHRAFCDALAEESVRAITAANPLLLSSQQPGSSVSHLTNLQPQLHSHALHALSMKKEDYHFNAARVPADSIPPWLPCPGVGNGPGLPSINLSSSPLLLGHPLSQNENPSQNPSSNILPPFQAPTASPHMSATALLQKAAQMGVTMSKPPLQSPITMQRPRQHQAYMSGTTGFSGSASFASSAAGSGLGLSAHEELGSGFPHGLASFGNKASVTSGFMEQVAATNSTAGAGAGLAGATPNSPLHDMMSSLSSPSGFDGSSSFEQSFNGTWNTKRNSINFQDHLSKTTESQLSRSDHGGRGSGSASSNIGGNDGLTRDFLGLKAFPRRDFSNLTALNRINNSSSAYGQQNQLSQTPWQG